MRHVASRDGVHRLAYLKRKSLWLLVAAALVIGWIIYRSRSGSNLNVEPHAREEIEKARER